MRGPAAAAWLCLALTWVGCGYSSGKLATQSEVSVGVEIFDNDSPLRDIERDLQGEISRAVRNLIQAPIAESRRADRVIRGRVIDYRRRGGVRDTENNLLETGLGLAVEARLVDRRTGEELAYTHPPMVWVGYIFGSMENELDARERALRNVAEQLVLDLFIPGE